MGLHAANTAIVVDSTACLPDPTERCPTWRTVPTYVLLDGESFRDWVDISPRQLYDALRSGAAPTTSQPSPLDFEAAFEALSSFERIVAVIVAERLSGTYGSARLGAGENVTVFDSGAIMGVQVLLADAIQRRLERGTDDDELASLADRFRREARCIYMLETLEYLARGGRIGRVARLAGQLLAIRPIIDLQGGENVPVGRAHSRGRAIAAMERIVDRDAPAGDGLHVGIVHGACGGDALALADAVRRLRPSASVDLVCEFSPTLCAHTGPGALGVFWFQD